MSAARLCGANDPPVIEEQESEGEGVGEHAVGEGGSTG